MSDLEQFSRYSISQGEGYAPIALPRMPEEVVCLALDNPTQCLVELHVLKDSESLDAAQRQSFHERASLAEQLRGPSFCRLIDHGEHEDLLYYVTAINDGEFLRDYVRRLGPLDIPVALSLVIQLCDAVLRLAESPRLYRGLSLSNLQAVLIDGCFVALRVVDLGLCREEPPDNSRSDDRRTARELSQILYFLLAAEPYPESEPAILDRLTGLPANLKFLMRHALEPGSNKAPTSVEAFRKELSDSFAAVSQRLTRVVGFKPITVPSRLHPRFCLHDALFADVEMQEQIGERYQISDSQEVCPSPYSVATRDREKERDTVIQLLPAARTLPLDYARQVMSEMAGIKPDKHPNLLRARGVWSSDRFTFVAEELPSGFGLPQILSERAAQLEPAEVVVVMRQLLDALEQARSAGIAVCNLSTPSIAFHFPGSSQFRVREYLKRHIDCWPPFHLKLRCHPTLDSVIQVPPSARLQTSETGESENSAAPVPLAKAFVGIAEHLSIGTWDEEADASPGDEDARVRQELRDFFRKSYRAIDEAGADFDLAEFVTRLEPALQSLSKSRGPVVGTIVDGAAGLVPPQRPDKERVSATEQARETSAPRAVAIEKTQTVSATAGSGGESKETKESKGEEKPGDYTETDDGPVSLGVISDFDADSGADGGLEDLPPSPPKKKGWFSR